MSAQDSTFSLTEMEMRISEEIASLDGLLTYIDRYRDTPELSTMATRRAPIAQDLNSGEKTADGFSRPRYLIPDERSGKKE